MRLIVGGDSYIGSALHDVWSKRGVACQTSTRKKILSSSDCLTIDLEKCIWPRQLEGYSSAVICAGINDVSICEHNVEFTRKVNVDGVIALARELSRNGTSLYLLSSTRVFDGVRPFPRTTSRLCPVTEYGRQKARVEVEFLRLSRGYIIRITKVINEESSLINKWREDLENSIPIHPFSDIYIAPVSIDKVVRDISSIVSNPSGKRIHHISARKEISYTALALRLCKKWGYDKNLVHPISAGQDHSNLPIHSSLAAE